MKKSCGLFTAVIFTMVFVLVTSYTVLWPISSQLDAYASPQAQVNTLCSDPEYAAANPSKCGEDQGPQEGGPCAGDPEHVPAYCRPPDCSIPEFASSDCGEPALPDSERRMFVPPTNSGSGNEPQDLAETESEEGDTGPAIDETEEQAIDEPQDLAETESEEEFGTISRTPSNVTNNMNNAMNVTGNDL
jgi:hypothetical protein